VTPLSFYEWFLSNQNKQGGTAIRMIVPFCQEWQRGTFFGGMVVGFYSAPIKKGISVSCGNNNAIQKEK
jgi:hypothetical protein